MNPIPSHARSSDAPARQTVLIVDDTPQNLTILGELLQLARTQQPGPGVADVGDRPGVALQRQRNRWLAVLALVVGLAAWLARRMPALRWLIFVLAGAAAIWSALALANSVAPMPTLIAADRSPFGTLGLMACGSVGALLFGLLGRRVRYRAQPTPSDSL